MASELAHADARGPAGCVAFTGLLIAPSVDTQTSIVGHELRRDRRVTAHAITDGQDLAGSVEKLPELAAVV